jgi:hypothetical protein
VRSLEIGHFSGVTLPVESLHSASETQFGLWLYIHHRHNNRKTVVTDKTGDSLQDAQQMPRGSAAEGFPSLVQRRSDGAEAWNLAKCSSARG